MSIIAALRYLEDEEILEYLEIHHTTNEGFHSKD
jgi:hypothetical protein